MSTACWFSTGAGAYLQLPGRRQSSACIHPQPLRSSTRGPEEGSGFFTKQHCCNFHRNHESNHQITTAVDQYLFRKARIKRPTTAVSKHILESSEIRLCENGHSWHNHNQQWLASSHSLHPHPLTLRHSHARHPLLREHRPKGSIQENLRRGKWTNGPMHGWIHEWMPVWIYGWTDEWNQWINKINRGKWNSSIQKGDLEAILGPLRLRPILLRSFGELLRQPWTNIKNVQAHDTWAPFGDKGPGRFQANQKVRSETPGLLVLWLGYRDPF